MSLTVTLRPEQPHYSAPKRERSKPNVMRNHLHGAVCLSHGRYVGVMELKEQIDTQTSNKVMTIIVRYLLKSDKGLKSIEREYQKKNIVVIDFNYDRKKPTVIVEEDKFNEICRVEDSILPNKIFPLLKIKRSSEELSRNPAKGEFKKLHITEGFHYGKMPTSEYNRIQISRKNN